MRKIEAVAHRKVDEHAERGRVADFAQRRGKPAGRLAVVGVGGEAVAQRRLQRAAQG